MLLNSSKSSHSMPSSDNSLLSSDESQNCSCKVMAEKKPALSAGSVWCEAGDKQMVDQEVSPGGRGREVQKGAGARYNLA